VKSFNRKNFPLLVSGSYIFSFESMSDHVYKEHNKTLLLNHLVFPTKYRQKVITPKVETTLKEVCTGISERYEILFLETGSDTDHVHFLVQSDPT
jgi:REP-associated tyrosine transposase